MKTVYLDNSATTQVCRSAADKVLELMVEKYGNPSSLHTMGYEAEQEIVAAREAVANMLGVKPREVTFTSGGTEANNLALLGAARARKRMGNRIVTTSIEHPSVLAAVQELEKQGFETVYITPESDGRVDPEKLAQAVDTGTILVSMMWVNNEVGAIQPVEQVKRIITRKKAPALFHVDAVQAFGKLPTRPAKLGIDLMTVSGHKIHAPKGIGALYVGGGTRILPNTFGGGQENNLRPGTEAAPLIAGLGAAVTALPEPTEQLQQIRKLRDYTKERLLGLPGVEINSPEDGLPYLLNFSVPGIRSETMLHHLAAGGVFVSSGSACAKGKLSHVLESMGLSPDRIVSAIRVSFSRMNTQEDADALVKGVSEGMKILARAR